MKKIITLIIFVLAVLPAFTQEIVNFVLVGKNGITEDIKEALSFIVIKQYPDRFQRLDYKIGLPLERIQNYSDSTLKILDGHYYEYSFIGALTISGTYINNLKEKDWYYYNDTGKVILEQKYEMGVLINTVNPDTVKKKNPGDGKLKDGESEARFGKGEKDWVDYLRRNWDHEAIEKSVQGGKVRVGFTVNTSGQCTDVYLRRSAEFVLDEAGIRLIENSPPWQPAIQDGKKVNAYRVQPFTYLKEEN
jgi:TonB family protein